MCAVVRVLSIESMMLSMQACHIPNAVYIVHTFSSARCTLCIHTTGGEADGSHRVIMGAVLTNAAGWRLVHSQ